jgi:general secretion pathway protein B
MSFILDALKKSESDRQRQTGPALFEAQIAPPRPRPPLWSIVVATLLGVNALIFGGWLLVRTAHPVVAVATTAVPAATAGAGVPATPGVSAVSAKPAPPGAAATASAGMATAAEPALATHRLSAPRDPELAALDAEPDAAAPGTGSPGNSAPVDDAPAVVPATAPRDLAPGVRIQRTSLPTRDELHSPAVAALPELRLDLHVYDPSPAKRFVLINMHRLREGESLPEGVRVEHITADGAELEYQGQRFLLPRE